jgi:hypothetical protein
MPGVPIDCGAGAPTSVLGGAGASGGRIVASVAHADIAIAKKIVRSFIAAKLQQGTCRDLTALIRAVITRRAYHSARRDSAIRTRGTSHMVRA